MDNKVISEEWDRKLSGKARPIFKCKNKTTFQKIYITHYSGLFQRDLDIR